jgi:hypothetical protein
VEKSVLIQELSLDASPEKEARADKDNKNHRVTTQDESNQDLV